MSGAANETKGRVIAAASALSAEHVAEFSLGGLERVGRPTRPRRAGARRGR